METRLSDEDWKKIATVDGLDEKWRAEFEKEFSDHDLRWELWAPDTRRKKDEIARIVTLSAELSEALSNFSRWHGLKFLFQDDDTEFLKDVVEVLSHVEPTMTKASEEYSKMRRTVKTYHILSQFLGGVLVVRSKAAKKPWPTSISHTHATGRYNDLLKTCWEIAGLPDDELLYDKALKHAIERRQPKS